MGVRLPYEVDVEDWYGPGWVTGVASSLNRNDDAPAGAGGRTIARTKRAHADVMDDAAAIYRQLSERQRDAMALNAEGMVA